MTTSEHAREKQAFVTGLRWKDTNDHTLIIDCSDYRLSVARAEFLAHLHIYYYSSVIGPGGPAVFTLNDAFCFLDRERVRLLHNLHNFKRIIGIAHYDCGYYKHKYPGDNETERSRRQRADLLAFQRDIAMPGVRVEIFYCGPNENGSIAYTNMGE